MSNRRGVEHHNDDFRIIMEIISGAHFDQDKGEFSRIYTPEEYKQKFGIEPHFFADWLQNTGLDHRYWNKLLHREKFAADKMLER